MSEWFEGMLSILLTALGIVSMPDAAALGLTVAVVAVTVLLLAVALSALPSSGRGSPHPQRAIDVSVLVSQSDPGADGHPRPRAPGAASAA